MDDWIHCNKCCKRPGREPIGFWFTQCGHIICNDCFNRGASINAVAKQSDEVQRRKCVVCAKEGVGHMAVHKKMRAEVLELFKPQRMLLFEYTQRLNKALEFQSHQRERLQKHQQQVCNKAIERYQTAERELKKLEQKFLEEQRVLNAKLEKAQHKSTQLLNSISRHSVLEHSSSTASNTHNPLGNVNTPSPLFKSQTFLTNRPGIRHIPFNQPITYASYHASMARNEHKSPYFNASNHRSFTVSASFFNHPSSSSRVSTPVVPGRITKGSVLPPSFDIHDRKHK